jgi:hypothetical protein
MSGPVRGRSPDGLADTKGCGDIGLGFVTKIKRVDHVTAVIRSVGTPSRWTVGRGYAGLGGFYRHQRRHGASWPVSAADEPREWAAEVLGHVSMRGNPALRDHPRRRPNWSPQPHVLRPGEP